MTTDGYKVSFGGDNNGLKIDYSDNCSSVNTLETIELPTSNGWT